MAAGSGCGIDATVEVVVKRDGLIREAKPSIFLAVHVPVPIYVHEVWAMAKNQIEAAIHN